MARRGVDPLLATFADAFSRLIAAICSAAFALMLWNVAGRAPHRLLGDLAAGLRNPRFLVQGALRIAVGFIFAALALLIIARIVAFGTSNLFSAFSIGAFCAALAVDGLIGDDVRRAMGIKR